MALYRLASLEVKIPWPREARQVFSAAAPLRPSGKPLVPSGHKRRKACRTAPEGPRMLWVRTRYVTPRECFGLRWPVAPQWYEVPLFAPLCVKLANEPLSVARHRPHQRWFAGWSHLGRWMVDWSLRIRGSPFFVMVPLCGASPGKGGRLWDEAPLASPVSQTRDPTESLASRGVFPLCRVINRGHWADVRIVKIWSFRIRGPPCHVRCFWSIAATYTGARFAPDGACPQRRVVPSTDKDMWLKALPVHWTPSGAKVDTLTGKFLWNIGSNLQPKLVASFADLGPSHPKTLRLTSLSRLGEPCQLGTFHLQPINELGHALELPNVVFTNFAKYDIDQPKYLFQKRSHLNIFIKWLFKFQIWYWWFLSILDR